MADNMALVKGGTAVELTPDAKRIHHNIENAGKDRSGPPSDDTLKAEALKTMKETFDLLISNDKLCTEQDLLDYMSSTIEQQNQLIQKKSAQVGLQMNGGGYVIHVEKKSCEDCNK